METTAPGKILLKVTGILLIIGGVLSIIVALFSLAGGGFSLLKGDQITDAGSAAVIGGVLTVAGIIALIGGVFNLVAGILGVKNANKPEKSQSCFVMGMIMIIVQGVGVIVTLLGGSGTSDSILSVIAGLVLPALYLLGAYKNKKA